MVGVEVVVGGGEQIDEFALLWYYGYRISDGDTTRKTGMSIKVRVRYELVFGCMDKSLLLF